jgi:predicted secreted protein
MKEETLSFNAKVGEVVKVNTKGIPGAGFVWEVSNPPKDVVIKVEPEQIKDEDMVGGQIEYTFSISAKFPGQYSVVLLYHRPWQSDYAEKLIININVTE